MAQNRRCAHHACNCEARPDDRYCSDYCRESRGILELACGCGHTTCTDCAAAGSPVST